MAPADPQLYGVLNLPYYCWAPPYRQSSGGIRAMHLLCHALNLLGEEAYVTTGHTHSELRTPTATQQICDAHLASGRQPIAVYPEVVDSNPLGAVNVARYLLAEPALHTGVPIDLHERDQVYTYETSLVPEGWEADVLRLPLVDRRVFMDAAEGARRSGSAVFINRYLYKGGDLDSRTEGSIEISPRSPKDSGELALILRSVEVLYTYEYSTIVFEALVSGCPVVFLPNDVMLARHDRWLFEGNGIAWGADPDQIAHAKATVPIAQKLYKKEEEDFWPALRNFVRKTQDNAVSAVPGQP